MTSTIPASQLSAEAYAEKLSTALLGAFEILGVYVGDRLGWYRSLADDGPATPTELASRTGTHERYCREWLEMQASNGTLALEKEEQQSTGGERRYRLPAGVAEVLTDEHSLLYSAPMSRMVAAVGGQLPNLLQAYRDGGGVSWDQLGDDARESQAALNRPWFESRLGPALAGCPQVHDVLAVPGARIADVGCGGGWSSIALALAYPQARVVGFDVDGPSVAMAERAATAAGLADRVTFRLVDGETLGEGDPFDAAFLFECLHDMARPVQVLSAIRRNLRPGGTVVVMDEAVADELVAPGSDVDQMMYGYSMFVCLPDGLSSTPSAGTGTVMRPAVLAGYAEQAGYHRVEVLPIEDFGFWRFYRLHG